MKVSQFKDYSELPLFLNAEMVAKVLGVSPSSGYGLMHEPGFPILKIGSRMVVPRRSSFSGWSRIPTEAITDEAVYNSSLLAQARPATLSVHCAQHSVGASPQAC